MDRIAPHKESIVLLAYSEPKKKHYIIVKFAHSRKAQLIRIDAESGILRWDQSVGRDTFENEAEALAYLQNHTQVEVLAHAKYVLGYVVLGPVALLLLTDAVRVSATLPGGHEIKTVTQSKWHRISLQQPELDAATQTAAKAELDRGIEKTMSFPMDGAHYFCETLDITRPFPSEHPAGEPSWPFVWNKALTLPFRAAGLDGPNTVCPALLQGMAESRELEDFDGRKFSYCLISRKCRLHVGPRYKARGLNENADPGNEIECDQVVWRHSDAPERPLAWSRYTWRRGSVPLWWTVNIKNGGMGEAEIKIRSTNTFRGSRRYVRRLQKRYMPDAHLDPDSDDGSTVGTDASLQVPVVFFSLLRKGTPDRDRSEAKLAEAFDFLAGQLRSLHKLPVSYVALDWHQMDKELGSEALVEGFWAQLSSLLPSQGFALGTMSKVGPDYNDNEGQELSTSIKTISSSSAVEAPLGRGCSPVGKGWVARWYKQQRGVTRYNCADSLDRTNVGSFFGAVQVFVEQCRELDIAIAATNSSAASVARQALIKRQAAAATAAVLAAAGSSGGGAAGTAAGSMAAQDKRSGSSGFLSSLGKGLNTVMGDLKMSPRTASPKGEQPLSHLTKDNLRVSSAPNIAALQQGEQQQQQQLQQMQVLRGPADNPWQQQQQQSSGDELPPGWEAKYDAVNKRVFYVDHNTKTTTWNKPQWTPPQQQEQRQQQAPGSPLASNGAAAAFAAGSSSSSLQQQQLAALSGGSSNNRSPGHSRPNSSHKSLQIDDGASGSDSDSDKERYEPLTPWCMFDYRYAKVRHFARRINPAALSAIAELFLMNGDMCAWLYTGSPAMHSEKITMFEAETSRLKKAGAGTYSNSFIAIRRRYNNVLMDEERKMQAEIFLGIKNKIYFPTLHVQYREADSVPDDFPESEDDESGEPDPLGLLTWPLDSKARGVAGRGAALVGMGTTAAAAGAKERQSAGSLGYDGSDLFVERTGNHTRSFSSEKIFQDFRDLHRSSVGQQQPYTAGAAAGVPKGGSPSVLAAGRPPLAGAVRPTPAAAAATTAAAAAVVGSKNLADFDSELSDNAPSDGNVLKPFEDPLGLL